MKAQILNVQTNKTPQTAKIKKVWRNLKCILLSERSPLEQATYCVIPTLGHSGKGKMMETVKIRGYQGLGRGEGIEG